MDEDATSRLAWVSAQFRLGPRLHEDAMDVSVLGSGFRLIRADQLHYFRDDVRHEIVPQHEARRLLQLTVTTQTIAATERAILQEAIPLLADTSARSIGPGLVLLRIQRHGPGSTASPADSGPPATPSQLHKAQAQRARSSAKEPPNERSQVRPPDQRTQVRPPDQRTQVRPPGQAAPLSTGAESPAIPVSAALSFYEVVVLDELETAIAGVEVELTTPNGTQTLLTDDSGRVRVDDVPPGTGSARIVGSQPLFDVLRDRVELDARRTPLPEGEDLLVLTPQRAGTSVSFPDAKTQRIMLVNRTDVVWGSVVEHWGDLLLLSGETDPCRLSGDELTAMLKLSSTGAGPTALIGLPPSGVIVRDDANLDITGEALADRVDEQARLRIDIDALHEALFAADFDAVGKLIEVAADEPPPAPAPPDFPFPSEEGVDFAAELSLLALQGITDLLEVPEEQV